MKQLALTVVFGGLASTAAFANDTADNIELEDLSWLSGSWVSENPTSNYEEHWLPASHGVMTGMFRMAVPEGPLVFEYIMITEEPDRIVMRFKHFNADYSTWEANEPLEFTLVDLKHDEAVFHSDVPDQHAPRQISYHLSEEGNLVATVSGSDESGDLVDSFSLEYVRQ